MTPADNHKSLDRTDTDFVERLASHYAPPALTPSQRAAFDAALRARLEKRRQRWTLFTPALATGVAAAVLLLSLSGRSGLDSSHPPDQREPSVVAADRREPLQLDTWEYDVFAFNTGEYEEGDEEGQGDENPLLPDDYLAIESVFLEG